MSAGYYQFLLFPKGCIAKMSEDGWKIEGSHYLTFSKLEDVFQSFDNVVRYIPEDIWIGSDKECYFKYDDGENVIEIEINSGLFKQQFREISVRFKLHKGEESFEKLVSFCKSLSESLEAEVFDMRINKIIDFDNQEILKLSKLSYESKI